MFNIILSITIDLYRSITIDWILFIWSDTDKSLQHSHFHAEPMRLSITKVEIVFNFKIGFSHVCHLVGINASRTNSFNILAVCSVTRLCVLTVAWYSSVVTKL